MIGCDIHMYSELMLPFSGLVASVREPSPEQGAVEVVLGLGSEDANVDGAVAGPAGAALVASFVEKTSFSPGCFKVA